MKTLMAGAFGFTVGYVITLVSSYTILDWQFWAADLSIMILGVIYANIPEKKG